MGIFKEQAGARAKNIGDGKQNTDIIAKSSTENNIAVGICSTLKLKGYSRFVFAFNRGIEIDVLQL